MARAVTRGDETVILGPGEYRAGAYRHTAPLDNDPASAREARETDDTLRECWLRTLERHEDTLAELLDAGDIAGATALSRAIERTAGAQVSLRTLDEIADAVLTAAGIQPSERSRAEFRRLALGGRDERTIRRWRSGESLVPEGGTDYLSRLRECEVVVRPRPDDPTRTERRLVLELLFGE